MKFLANALRELAWLAGCWLVSFLATGALVGFGRLVPGPLDIQVHNTYFVLTTGVALVPPFLVAAGLVTLVRARQQRFRSRATNAVLTSLAVGWVLLLALLAYWARLAK